MSATVAISGLQECSYCRRDLTRSCRISCAEEDCDKQLCVLCFSVGVRIEEHRPWHQYRVSTNLSFPVFSEDWTAHEELLLLDAIKQSGLGNWKDISEKVESKTDKRCAEHYWDLYTGRYGAQLPPEFYTQTGEKVPTSELVDAELLGGDAYEREKFQSKQGRPTGDTQKEGKQANVGKKQGGGAPGAPAERLAGADISGYMPLRGDFDHEHENDAEELLADMTFEDEEPEADVELKLQVIRVFNRKLDEREKRKDFVVSRGLLDYKRVLAAERKRPRDERDIISRLRPFARFHSAEQHAKLIDSIIATKRLKERIDQLMYYRSIGFLNISDGMQYEEEKKKMKEEERLRSRRASAPYLFNSQTVRRRSSSPVDVSFSARAASEAPDAQESDQDLQLLSTEEQQLCRDLKLSAAQYTTLKGAVLRRFLRSGKADFSAEDAKEAKEGRAWTESDSKVYDYWVSCGWLSTDPELAPKRQKT